MNLFHEIPDALAIVRKRHGIHVETKVFHRQERVYIGAAGGFVRICAKFGDYWATSHPHLTVVDISQSIPGLFVTKEPKYTVAREGWPTK